MVKTANSRTSCLGLYDRGFTGYIQEALGTTAIYAKTSIAIAERTKLLQDIIEQIRTEQVVPRKTEEELMLEAGTVFPFVSVHRVNDKSKPDVNYSSYMTGKIMSLDTDGNPIKLYMLPIDLEYQIDIWTLNQYDLDEYYRELLFLFYQVPHMYVQLKEDYTFLFPIEYLEDEDVTDEASWDDKQRLYHKSMRVNISDAQLFKIMTTKRVYWGGHGFASVPKEVEMPNVWDASKVKTEESDKVIELEKEIVELNKDIAMFEEKLADPDISQDEKDLIQQELDKAVSMKETNEAETKSIQSGIMEREHIDEETYNNIMKAKTIFKGFNIRVK